jgi:hypothetical protein
MGGGGNEIGISGVPLQERRRKVTTIIIRNDNVEFLTMVRNDHTTVTAPLPVCSAKLSTVGPG